MCKTETEGLKRENSIYMKPTSVRDDSKVEAPVKMKRQAVQQNNVQFVLKKKWMIC